MPFRPPFGVNDDGTITVLLTAGEPETGLWCGKCLLSSRARVPLYQVDWNGSTLVTVIEVCPGCEETSADDR
jgi:hypothetical protein